MAFTSQEKAKEAAREVQYRQWVYSKKISEGSMTQKQAEKRISLMQEICEDYEKLAEGERLL